MSRVVVVGSFNLDHAWHAASLPRPGETLSGSYASGPGGKGFNQAVAAARAGAGVAFACALGGDAAGEVARTMAHAEGIDLRARASDAPTGSAGIVVDAAGANSIVVAPGANASLDADFVAAQSEAIGLAAVVLAQLEVPVDAVREALRLGREAGAATVLDPAPSNVEVPPDVLALADIITPNDTEFAALLARNLGEAVPVASFAAVDDATLHAWCRRLLPGGRVVLTLGGDGCFVSHPDHAPEPTGGGGTISFARLPAAHAQPRDTTGAGDAFAGALAASLALDLHAPFHAHVRFAARYAALSTERAGAATAMPRRGEVLARFGP